MEALTRREYQVADLIHQGYVEKEIANLLFVSPGTVHTHKKRLFAKLHARNIADITRIFILELSNPRTIILMLIALTLQVLAMVQENSELRKPNRAKISDTVRYFARKAKTNKSFKWIP